MSIYITRVAAHVLAVYGQHDQAAKRLAATAQNLGGRTLLRRGKGDPQQV